MHPARSQDPKRFLWIVVVFRCWCVEVPLTTHPGDNSPVLLLTGRHNGEKKDQFRTLLGNVALVESSDRDESAVAHKASAFGASSPEGSGGGGGGDADLLRSGSNATEYQQVLVFAIHSQQRTLKVPMKVYFSSAVVRSSTLMPIVLSAMCTGHSVLRGHRFPELCLSTARCL